MVVSKCLLLLLLCVNSLIYNSAVFRDLTKLFSSQLVYWTLCTPAEKWLGLHALLWISARLGEEQRVTHSLSSHPLSYRPCARCSTAVLSLLQEGCYQTARILHRGGRMKDSQLLSPWNLSHSFPIHLFPHSHGHFYLWLLGLADVPDSTRWEVSLQLCPVQGQGQDIFSGERYAF